MKKTILTILLCGALILGLTGCGKTKAEFEIGNKSDITISKNDITMSIKDGTLTNEGTTLVLKNDSDKLLRYNEGYGIEVKQNENWYSINVEIEFNVPLWELASNSEKEIELNWKNSYGKLPSGKYRIVKKVYFENEEEQEFYISAEFNIDKD